MVTRASILARSARDRRAAIAQLNPDRIQHGLNAYENYACRCDECKYAKSVNNHLRYLEQLSPIARYRRSILLKLL